MGQFEDIISGKDKSAVAVVARGGLSALSTLYCAATRTRNFLYDRGVFNRAKMPCPVISVGNVTAGGTGKTPMVEFIARHLMDAGKKVVVLSRGYRAQPGDDGPCNDEARMLAENLPGLVHVQNKHRAAAGFRACREHNPDCILLDDGFQHRQVRRDCDIVLFDATNPFGYRHLLPRGLLREPVSAARRAHCAVVTKSDEVPHTQLESLIDSIARVAPGARVFTARYTPGAVEPITAEDALPLADLAGKRVLGFCGIGAPNSFRATLENLGCEIAAFVEFDDHHDYCERDATRLTRKFKALGAEVALTTHKDAVKLRKLDIPQAYALKVKTTVDDEAAFRAFVDGIVNKD